MATQLTDLEVDRVDAVDRPATRRKFLILKDETGAAGAASGTTEGGTASTAAAGDPATAAAEAKDLIAKATGALTELRKADALVLPAAAITALNELIDAVGDAAITKFEAPAAPAETAKSEAAPAAPDFDQLAEKIAKGVVDGIRKAADADYAAAGNGGSSAPPASTQATGVPVAKSAPKLGDGLFSNIVNG